LIGAALTGLGAVLLSIYADVLPLLLPALTTVPIATLLKVIALLLLSLVLAGLVAVGLFLHSKPKRPLVLYGKEFGLKWVAELDYSRKRNTEVEVEVHWFCPKHRVLLGAKSAEIPDTAYYTLFCAKCDRLYPLEIAGAPVHLEEAKEVVRLGILSKIRLAQANDG